MMQSAWMVKIDSRSARTTRGILSRSTRRAKLVESRG